MENLKNTGYKRLEELKAKGEAQKGVEYRYLWVRVSYAVVKDGHIRKIGAQAYGVFTVVRAFMNQNGIAYPSLGTIAHLSGISVTTTQKEIKALIDNGWFQKDGRVRIEGGRFGNTIYRIKQTNLIRGSKQQGSIDNPVVQSTSGDLS